jgi:nucleoside-diphosphate-sugar epimerase
MSKSILILGCGYTGLAIAKLAAEAGWQVSGTARTEAGRLLLEEAGIRGFVFNGTTAGTELQDHAALADAILSSVPAGVDGDPAFHALQPALADCRAAWIGYLSTTAVYGDRGGRWVFESDTVAPVSPRALARVLAEQQWLSLTPSAHIFRLPGIYGPGRSPLDKIASGEARSIVKAGQVFSRCHRDDIAACVIAALHRPHPGWVFNVCDDLPCPAPQVNAFAAGLLGLPEPATVAFETADLTPMARQFYADNKRVSNARAKAALGWTLRYPTFREGLAAIQSIAVLEEHRPNPPVDTAHG